MANERTDRARRRAVRALAQRKAPGGGSREPAKPPRKPPKSTPLPPKPPLPPERRFPGRHRKPPTLPPRRSFS